MSYIYNMSIIHKAKAAEKISKNSAALAKISKYKD